MTNEEKFDQALGVVEEIESYELVGAALSDLSTVQETVSGLVPGAISEEVTNKQIAVTAFALVGEIFELAQEVGWKDWKSNGELTEEKKMRIADEFADVLAFLGLLTLLIMKRTGLKSDDFAEAYFQKSKKNIQRFFGVSGEEGYDSLI